MGGTETWQNIQYIRMTHAGHKHWLEQSEHPDGPFITSYEVVEELRAVHELKLHRKETTRMFQSAEASQSEVMLNGQKGTMKFGERQFPIPLAYRSGFDEWVRYAPEKLILDALKQTAVFEGMKALDGTDHMVISYVQDELKHQLYINPHTRLLGQAIIETYQPYDVFNYPWGKFETTIRYTLNWLYDGIRYPAQWDVYKLGKPFRSITITAIDFNPQVPDSVFKIPDNLPPSRPAVLVEKTPLPTKDIIEVAPGIHTIPGSWYVGHIVQSDGIWVIEGPISSGYNAQHLAFIKEKYPDKPIKGVFSTSDAWPHLGGIRPFAAEGIPIYTQFLNVPTLQHVLEADHSPLPDAYQEHRKTPKFKPIKEAFTLEDTDIPIQVIPVNGEGGERMLMLYFPKQKVLYASDLVQHNPRNQSFFSQQYLSEVKHIVDTHQLEVETLFAMHTSPLPWTQVLEAIK